MTLSAEQEGRHEPGPELHWNESWYFDFAQADGSFGGYVRVGHNPNQGRTWYLLYLVGKDLPTVRIDDKDLPLLDGFTVTTQDYRFSHEGVDGTWRISGSGVAESLDPVALLAGKQGTPVQVAVDLVWEPDGLPFHYEVTTRYELPCLVSGTVTVDGTTYTLVKVEGQRDHSHGTRDWQQQSWLWSAARLADGTRLHVIDVLLPGLRYTTGYLQDGAIDPVTDVARQDSFSAEGLPTETTLVLAPSGLEVTIRSLAHGPTLMTADDGRQWPFQRSLAHFETSAGTGVGWVEWNRTDLLT